MRKEYFIYFPDEKDSQMLAQDYTNVVLLGTTTNEILNTLQWYKWKRNKPIKIPSLDEIIKDDSNIEIICNKTCGQIPCPKEDIDYLTRIKINGSKIKIIVFPDMIEKIKRFSNSGNFWKRGSLYKLITGRNLTGAWFLPEEYMQYLREYNWDKRIRELNPWLKEREKKLKDFLENKTSSTYIKRSRTKI